MLQLGQERALVGDARLYNRHKPLKHAYARPSKRLRHPQTSPPEFAKHQSESAKEQAGQADRSETALPLAEMVEAGERRERLRDIASDLLYWKGGLKVLRQAQLPKWRGSFRWQIEARIEALQAAYATLRAEAAKYRRVLKILPSPER